MAVKTKEQIMQLINEKFKDDTSDETLSFIEDVSDTFTDMETRSTDSTNWQKKFEDNDKMWREKYRNRFFNGGGNDDGDGDPEPTPQPDHKLTFEDLFKEG